MAKVSPMVRSFNGGEFSRLMEGRTDVDRYPSSCRSLLNCVAAPQGPLIARSGTQFIGAVYDHTKRSSLVPFTFSETEAYMLEFADGRVRFFTEDGILIKTPVNITITDDAPFLVFDSATLNGAIGDEVAFLNFPDDYNMNGEVARITNKVGTVYTVNIPLTQAVLYVGAQAALVYHIASPYTEAQLDKLRDLQSLDTIYLVHPDVKPYKLKRKNTYDWVFEAAAFTDGPYLDPNETTTKLTPSARGVAIPTMTANGAPSGTASGSSALAGTDYYMAFDNPDTATYWESNTNQAGTIQYQAAAAFVCDGYSIHMATKNDNVSYTAKNYAPATWTFEGSNNGVNWDILDRQVNYVLYDNNKSVFFTLKNATAYSYHRLVIENINRNGPIKPRVRNLVLRSTASATGITLTASSAVGINNDQGFLASDVGRLIRLKGSEGSWRSVVITGWTSATVVTVTLLGEPFGNLQSIQQFRMGYWSTTTGWPNALAFYQDRLWWGGSTSYPDLIVGSCVGQYENMTQSSSEGVVLDTHAIVQRLNSRKLSRVKWMAESDKGLLLGTGSQEFVISAVEGSDKTITPGNAKARNASSRGSSDTEPVPIDNQVLFVKRSGRAVHEYAWQYESDGYKSPSMSMLASHLGVSPFEKMAYTAEPYSIIWMLRQDGNVVAMTYNRDENVVGWHRHDFSDGIVESLASIPASDQLQDALWLIIRRTINGVTKRYVEKLTRFWDFDMVLTDAHYVDCGLKYVGAATDIIYGLQHLEGREDIYGLADGIPIGPMTVEKGSVTLPNEAEIVTVGIGFDAYGETSRLENGAEDGTAIGKVKRMTGISLLMWQSYGGSVGTRNGDTGEVDWTPIEYPGRADEVETIQLFDGIIGPVQPAPGYEKDGSVHFRRSKAETTPFNIVALMPQMVTQDRG